MTLYNLPGLHRPLILNLTGAKFQSAICNFIFFYNLLMIYEVARGIQWTFKIKDATERTEKSSLTSPSIDINKKLTDFGL